VLVWRGQRTDCGLWTAVWRSAVLREDQWSCSSLEPHLAPSPLFSISVSSPLSCTQPSPRHTAAADCPGIDYRACRPISNASDVHWMLGPRRREASRMGGANDGHIRSNCGVTIYVAKQLDNATIQEDVDI